MTNPQLSDPRLTAHPAKTDNSLGQDTFSWKLWWPVSVMMLCSLLSYIDRQTLAVLSPMILSELNLSALKYSQIISAFSFAYMLANPVWGVVLDRIGLRRGMTIAVILWTIASGAHAALYGFFGFVAARTLLGFGEGATFPGGLRTAMHSLPPRAQSRGIAMAYSGGTLGAIVTPVLVTPIAIAYGWRAAFIFTGIAGLLWVVLWRRTVDFSVFASSSQTQRVILPNITEGRFWGIVASYALGALPFGVILYLAPLYLSRVLGFTQAELGHILWVPPLGAELGFFFWGWFADRYAAGNSHPSWLFFLLAFLGLPLAGVTMSDNSVIVLGLMFWAMFIASGFMVVSLRTGALAYPREQTSLVAGIGAGSWSAAIAILLPLLGRMFDAKHYANAFYLVGIIPVAGAALWWIATRGDRRQLEV